MPAHRASHLLGGIGQVVIRVPSIRRPEHLGGLRPAQAGSDPTCPHELLLPGKLPAVHGLAALPLVRGGRPPCLPRVQALGAAVHAVRVHRPLVRLH